MNEQNSSHDKREQHAPAKAENLIHLSEKQIASAMPDLNARLRDIESELKHLNAREAATNKSFLELSSETRKNLTGQTSRLDQTQQKMSDISGQYNKISQDYQRIAAASNLLSAQMENSLGEIREQIDSVDVAATRKSHELEQSIAQLIERASHIESRASQLAEDMQSRFDIMQTTLQAVESRLLQEVAEFAQQSEQRDESLSIRIDKVEEENASNIRDLRDSDAAIQQDVDVLSGQVDVLEARVNENVSRLDDVTEDLTFQTEVLNTRTDELETFAEVTEEKTAFHSVKLREITKRIERHHVGFAIAIVLIAITLAVVGFTQQTRWHEMLNTETQLQAGLDAQGAVQQDHARQLASMAGLEQTVIDKVDARQGGISDEISNQSRKLEDIQQSLKAIEAQQANEASRLTALVPGRSFGLDNTIHNAAWLATQDKNQFVIDVITVKDKQAMYDAAFRWASLLNESHLSFIEQTIDGEVYFTLIYGTFADRSVAEKISRYMPVVNFNDRPVVRQLSEIL
jgi:DNA repair exonuclease SbcCD ATPase subunit